MENGEMVLTIGERRALMPYQYYKIICEFIVHKLDTQQTTPLVDLIERAHEHFRTQIKGDLAWYFLNVKQDLEARKVIKVQWERNRTQVIRLKRRYKERLAQSQLEVKTGTTYRVEAGLAS